MDAQNLIIYVDHSEVREGKRRELEAALDELVELIGTNEPRLLAYNVYFAPDGKRSTVMHIHSDAASLDFHMDVAGPAFPKFIELVNLKSIDVYGQPSDATVIKLQQKAHLLGNATLTIHDWHAGIANLGGLDLSQAMQFAEEFIGRHKDTLSGLADS